MEPRRLKVGDIVDDYCPRERRITDHAVVAMIDDGIRQTRCTACDNEHPYKDARAPRTRRKNTQAALYSEVLARVSDGPAPSTGSRAEASADPPAAPVTEDRPVEDATAPADSAPRDVEAEEPPVEVDEGPVHRPLIRATLPRPEGTPPPQQRNIPEFTVRQSNMRGRFREEFRGGFRGAHGASGRNGGQQGQGQQGQGRPGRSGRPSGSPKPHARPRHGRPSPHKKRSR